jgi:hypothetical protein
MYDLEGADAGREWVEVINSGDAALDLSLWKFFEGGVNHGLSLFQGETIIPAGGFAIIADNAANFLADNPGFTGSVFDSSFSLSNTGEALSLKNEKGEMVDTFVYSADLGASGDGYSLQKINTNWLAAAPTPGFANSAPSTSSSVVETVNSSGTGAGLTSGSASSGSVVIDSAKKITAEAGGDRQVIVGAETVFKGEAFGIKGEPLLNARFVWNMGDGQTLEGSSVKYAYRFPGEYIVMLHVSTNELSATDRLVVTASPSNLRVSRILPGENGFIEIANDSATTADISGWFLESRGKFFLLPSGTIIGGGKTRFFPNQVTGLILVSDDAPALLYPNGVKAAQFFETKPTAEKFRSSSQPSFPSALAVDDQTILAAAAAKVDNRQPSVVNLSSPKTQPLDVASTSVSTVSTEVDVQTGENTFTSFSSNQERAKTPLMKWLIFLAALVVTALVAYFASLAYWNDQKQVSAAEKDDVIPVKAARYKIIEEKEDD